MTTEKVSGAAGSSSNVTTADGNTLVLPKMMPEGLATPVEVENLLYDGTIIRNLAIVFDMSAARGLVLSEDGVTLLHPKGINAEYGSMGGYNLWSPISAAKVTDDESKPQGVLRSIINLFLKGLSEYVTGTYTLFGSSQEVAAYGEWLFRMTKKTWLESVETVVGRFNKKRKGLPGLTAEELYALIGMKSSVTSSVRTVDGEIQRVVSVNMVLAPRVLPYASNSAFVDTCTAYLSELVEAGYIESGMFGITFSLGDVLATPKFMEHCVFCADSDFSTISSFEIGNALSDSNGSIAKECLEVFPAALNLFALIDPGKDLIAVPLVSNVSMEDMDEGDIEGGDTEDTGDGGDDDELIDEDLEEEEEELVDTSDEML